MRLLLATLAATAHAQNPNLVIVAQFKNEAESLPQWLDHYLTDEGVAAMLLAANNYATSLIGLQRFEEARPLLRRTIPVARRVHGDSNDISLYMRANYARALYDDPAATLDDLREAVTTLEEIERTARRVFGSGHPAVGTFVITLGYARAALRARETPSPSA